MADQFNTDLLDVYLLWMKDREKYNDLMDNRVSKIINYLLSTSRLVLYYDERCESYEDMVQQAKAFVFSRILPKIEEPTSKRIFNYIEVNLRYKFKLGGRKKIAKIIDNNFAELNHGIHELKNKDIAYNNRIDRSDAIFFDVIDRSKLTSQEKKAVRLLAEGYSRAEVMDEISWLNPDWNKFRKKVAKVMVDNEIHTPRSTGR